MKRTILCLALLVLASPSLTQEAFKPDSIPFRAGQVLRYRAAEEIPAQLKAGIARHCRLPGDRTLKELPIVLVPQHPAFAIVPCEGGSGYVTKIFAFERSLGQAPVLIRLPVIDEPAGFITHNEWAGWHEWDAERSVLIGTTVNDSYPQVQYRHHYRNLWYGFNLFKVEVRFLKMPGSENSTPWQPLWDAQDWPKAKR